MKLKLTPFFSSRDTLSDEIIIFCRKPWIIVHGFDDVSFNTRYSSLEGATKLKFVPFGFSFRWYHFLVSGRMPGYIYLRLCAVFHCVSSLLLGMPGMLM